MLSNFSGLRIKIGEGWLDISDDIDTNSPPTLALHNGIGAMQFSVAMCHEGDKPRITLDDLTELLVEFCRAHSFSDSQPSILVGSSCQCVGALSVAPTELISIWYLSNGIDIALITYTSLSPSDPKTKRELFEAEKMVRSIEFPG